MNIQDALLLYAGLFEEVWDADSDLMEVDNWYSYEKVIHKLRIMGAISGRNTYLEAIEEKRNQLPF